MSKYDFEMYELAGQEFVIPPPNNDFYGGLYIPSGDLMPPNFQEKLQDVFATDEVYIAIFSGVLDRVSGFTARQAEKAQEKSPDLTVAQSAVLAEVYPPEGPLFEHEIAEQFQKIREYVASTPQIDLAESCPEAPIDLADKLRGRISPSLSENPHDFPFLTNHKRERINPNTVITLALQGRAYRWLPGPERHRINGDTLPPVYNPRPVPVLSICSVRVELVNPYAR